MADKNDKPSDKPKAEQRKPLSVVPVGEAYSNLADDKHRWRVAVDNFGGLTRGAKVGAIHMQPGTPIDLHVERGNLIPLDEEESAEAVNDPPAVPQYAVANLQPPKPDLPADHARTFEDAVKADDLKKAEDAKKEAEHRKAEEEKARKEADAKAAEKK